MPALAHSHLKTQWLAKAEEELEIPQQVTEGVDYWCVIMSPKDEDGIVCDPWTKHFALSPGSTFPRKVSACLIYVRKIH